MYKKSASHVENTDPVRISESSATSSDLTDSAMKGTSEAVASGTNNSQQLIRGRQQDALARFTEEGLVRKATEYCMDHIGNSEEDLRIFAIAARLLKNPERLEAGFTEDEKYCFQLEQTKRFHQPWKFWLLNMIGSFCAIIQGMGEFYS